MNRVIRLSGSRRYAEEVLRDNPSVYWRLGELSGTAAVDSSRNRLADGLYVGTPTLGTAGHSLDGDTGITLNGVDMAMKYTGAPVTQLTGLTTMEAWIYPTTITTLQCIYQNGGSASGFGMQISAASELSYFSRGVATTVGLAAIFPSANAWYHVAVQDDGVNILFWINGKHVDTQVRPSVAGVDTSESNVGRFTSGAYARYFTGVVDEVAVYATLLSPARVRAHYRAGTVR